MKEPVIELDQCILCEVCVEICPEAFTMNDLGYIEVVELKEYPDESLAEAVKNCPADCIIYHKE